MTGVESADNRAGRRPPLRRPGLAIAAATATLLLAACGTGGKPINSLTPAPATSPTTRSTATPSTTAPALTPTQQTIVARYRLFWSTVEQVEATNDYNSPALSDVATSDQLIALIDNMIKDNGQGITHKGTVILNPGVPVIASDGLSARLKDCQDGKDFLPYRNGQLVGPGVPRDDGVTATMWLVKGVWKVAATDFTVGRCDGT
jgi:hypothetical protein